MVLSSLPPQVQWFPISSFLLTRSWIQCPWWMIAKNSTAESCSFKILLIYAHVRKKKNWTKSMRLNLNGLSYPTSPVPYPKSTTVNLLNILLKGFVPCCCCSVAKSCQTLCNSVDCSPPGFSVLGIPGQECCSGSPFYSPCAHVFGRSVTYIYVSHICICE